MCVGCRRFACLHPWEQQQLFQRDVWNGRGSALFRRVHLPSARGEAERRFIVRVAPHPREAQGATGCICRWDALGHALRWNWGWWMQRGRGGGLCKPAPPPVENSPFARGANYSKDFPPTQPNPKFTHGKKRDVVSKVCVCVCVVCVCGPCTLRGPPSLSSRFSIACESTRAGSRVDSADGEARTVEADGLRSRGISAALAGVRIRLS